MGLTLALLSIAWTQENPRLGITLEDGSRFYAHPLSEPLRVQTEFGELEIPLGDVLSLCRMGKEQVEVRTTRLTVEGRLGMEHFNFETDFGKLRVPVAQIRELRSGRGGGTLGIDDDTVALWSFDNGGVDVVSRNPLKLVEGEIVSQEDGVPAFVRKTDGGYVQGTLPEGFAVGSGSFTIEVRVQIGSFSRGYATLVARNEEGSTHNRDFWFLVQRAGQLYFDSGNATTTHFVSQTPALVDPKQWIYAALVYDRTAGEFRYYVNGKKAHTDRRAATFHSTTGPLFLGPGASGKPYFSCPEKFQFLRLSKRARSEEEFAGIQVGLEGGGWAPMQAVPRGIEFWDGSFFRSDLPDLAGKKFRTEFGTLEIGGGTKGKIELYPLRERDIEAIQSEVAVWIEALGDPSVERREEAEEALKGVGTPAVTLLRAERDSSDPEVQTRVDSILNEFERTGVTRRPARDCLRMGRTIVYGWLDLSDLEVSLAYGTFRTDVRKIRFLFLSEPETSSSGATLRLRSGEVLQGTLGATHLGFETEFGELKVPLKEIVSLQYDEGKKVWALKTEKATVTGKVSGEKILLETGAGALAVPLGEIAELRQ